MTRTAAARMLAEVLERDGIMLVHDAVLPSASGLVAGEPVAGSWWAHPLAHQIYDALQPLDTDATRVKLIAGKETFVHRRLWPELLAVGRARQRWQTHGLGPDGRLLLERVGRYRRPVSVDDLGLDPATRPKPGDLVRDLERRLLLHTEEIHTESGAHAKHLESWRTFERRRGADRMSRTPTATEARRTFDAIVADWPAPTGRARTLPWD